MLAEIRTVLDESIGFEVFEILIESQGSRQKLDLFSEAAVTRLRELISASVPLPCLVLLECSGRLDEDKRISHLVVKDIKILMESIEDILK